LDRGNCLSSLPRGTRPETPGGDGPKTKRTSTSEILGGSLNGGQKSPPEKRPKNKKGQGGKKWGNEPGGGKFVFNQEKTRTTTVKWQNPKNNPLPGKGVRYRTYGVGSERKRQGNPPPPWPKGTKKNPWKIKSLWVPPWFVGPPQRGTTTPPPTPPQK